MQMAVIEYARNVLSHPNANSTEIDENTDYPVIDLMESQKGVVNKGEQLDVVRRRVVDSLVRHSQEARRGFPCGSDQQEVQKLSHSNTRHGCKPRQQAALSPAPKQGQCVSAVARPRLEGGLYRCIARAACAPRL